MSVGGNVMFIHKLNNELLAHVEEDFGPSYGRDIKCFRPNTEYVMALSYQ